VPRHVLQGKRILVVEDEYILASYLASTLEDVGAIVIGPVPSIEQALGVLKMESKFDAAVLDINLSGQPAFPVADALIELGTPFVFTTGYDEPALPGCYRAVARCVKPIDIRLLMRSLARMVGHEVSPGTRKGS